MNAPVALVTGAAGGIGRATAKTFGVRGYRLALTDTVDGVHELASEAEGTASPEVRTYCVDITDVDAVEKLARDVESVFGRLDTVALIAGVVQDAAGVSELDPVEWHRVLDTNLTGPFLLCRSLSGLLRRDGGGSITAVSSWWGRSGHAYFSAYCASKAALIVFIQSVAAELAPDIRANTVCPGNINTAMHRNALESEARERGISFEEMKEIEWAKIPMRQAGDPSAIADAIAFLSSPEASYITGASLDVNGGVVFH